MKALGRAASILESETAPSLDTILIEERAHLRQHQIEEIRNILDKVQDLIFDLNNDDED
jgi:hypothetical protein